QVEPGTEVALNVKLDDPKGRIEKVQLFYRIGSKDKFIELDADIDEGTARAKIPGKAVKPPFIEYYFLGYDKKGLAIVSRGDVGVDVDGERADEASAELFDLGASGVEERDATTLVKGVAGKTTLVASFATHDEANEAIAALPAEWNPHFDEVIGDAWRDEWKKH